MLTEETGCNSLKCPLEVVYRQEILDCCSANLDMATKVRTTQQQDSVEADEELSMNAAVTGIHWLLNYI